MKTIITTLLIFMVSLGTAIAQNNDVFIDQVGQNNNLEASQDGRNNTVEAYQSEGHSSIVDQTGNMNSVVINQMNFFGNGFLIGFPPGNGTPPPFNGGNEGGLSDGSYAEVNQEGNRNSAEITQEGGHWTSVSQVGARNEAYVNQDGGATGTYFNPPGVAEPCPPPFGSCSGSSESGSVSSIVQDGFNNMAEINQTGSFWANIQQYGNNNEATITQNLSTLPVLSLSTLGNGNGLVATSNSAQIIQYNNGNAATIIQNKLTENPIIVEQFGNEGPITVTHN